MPGVIDRRLRPLFILLVACCLPACQTSPGQTGQRGPEALLAGQPTKSEIVEVLTQALAEIEFEPSTETRRTAYFVQYVGVTYPLTARTRHKREIAFRITQTADGTLVKTWLKYWAPQKGFGYMESYAALTWSPTGKAAEHGIERLKEVFGEVPTDPSPTQSDKPQV